METAIGYRDSQSTEPLSLSVRRQSLLTASDISPQSGTSGGKAWFSAVVRRGRPLPHPPERFRNFLAKTL